MISMTSRSGFTLVEVLSSILLLVISIAASTSLLSNGMMALRGNGQDTIARAAAVRELERLRGLPWDDGDADPNNNILDLPMPSYSFTDGLLNFAGNNPLPDAVGRVYVDNIDFNGDATVDAKQVTIDVSVYGAANPLTAGLFDSLFESTAYASGGGGGGGGGGEPPPPGDPPPPGPPVGSLRSVWRLTTILSNQTL